MSRQRWKPEGQQRTYGVLVGTIQDGEENQKGNSPHYEIWVKAGEGDDRKDYRVAVNVESVDGSEVLAYYDPKYQSPNVAKLDLDKLATGSSGFTKLTVDAGGNGLDYLQDRLFDLQKMGPLPPDGPGMTLSNLLDGQIERAKADTGTVVIAFGEFFHDNNPDPTFHFPYELGVHDIHLMQGNTGRFASDNRSNGDGALFIRFSDGETVALFVRFNSQVIATDNTENPA